MHICLTQPQWGSIINDDNVLWCDMVSLVFTSYVYLTPSETTSQLRPLWEVVLVKRFHCNSGIILCMGSANVRRDYIVTVSLIGRLHCNSLSLAEPLSRKIPAFLFLAPTRTNPLNLYTHKTRLCCETISFTPHLNTNHNKGNNYMKSTIHGWNWLDTVSHIHKYKRKTSSCWWIRKLATYTKF